MDHDHTLYEEDFHAWTVQQAAALRVEARRHSNAPVDWENVAEEIECMGRSQRKEVRSRLRTLFVHLLKWLYCPDLRPRCENDWRTTIVTQRADLADEMRDSPSLRPFLAECFMDAYHRARPMAALEAAIPQKTFPTEPPFTLDQALDNAYPPELFPGDADA